MDIDFERAAIDRKLNPRKLALNQVYLIVKEEASGAKVTVDEIKALIRFVREKKGEEA